MLLTRILRTEFLPLPGCVYLDVVKKSLGSQICAPCSRLTGTDDCCHLLVEPALLCCC